MGGILSARERRENKAKAVTQRVNGIKEGNWSGRAEGMERSRDAEMKESVRLRKKGAQRGEVPPMDDTAGGGRTGSAGGGWGTETETLTLTGITDGKDESGQFVAKALTKARKASKKDGRKLAKVEQRLFNSPFAVSEVKKLEAAQSSAAAAAGTAPH